MFLKEDVIVNIKEEPEEEVNGKTGSHMKLKSSGAEEIDKQYQQEVALKKGKL